jgi:sugar-specific transcriptional regulator TrmB
MTPPRSTSKRRRAQPDAAKAPDRAADREQIGYLTELGLNLTEARVYVALLTVPEVTATEAADRAGVPRPKVYEALRSLEERGLCLSIAGKTTRFRAGDTDDALEALRAEREHERQHAAEKDQELVERLRERLPRPPTPSEDGRPFDYLEAVFGRSRTSSALERVLAAAERRLAIMQQPPFLQPRSRWNVAELEAMERGVELRIVYSIDGLTDPLRYAALARAGAEIRVVRELPMKLAISDDAEAMLSLRDPHTHEQGITSMVVRHPDLVSAFQLMFESQWEAARRLSRAELKRAEAAL